MLINETLLSRAEIAEDLCRYRALEITRLRARERELLENNTKLHLALSDPPDYLVRTLRANLEAEKRQVELLLKQLTLVEKQLRTVRL